VVVLTILAFICGNWFIFFVFEQANWLSNTSACFWVRDGEGKGDYS